MRHRVAAVFCAVLGVCGLSLASAPPAAANDVCAGTLAVTTGPLFSPVTVQPTLTTFIVRQPSTVGFGAAMAFGAGTCVSTDGTVGKMFIAGGTLSGWCGHASGQGIANDGANFAFVNIGGLLVVTGHIVGTMLIAPDVLAGQNCNMGATGFIGTGVLVLLHCIALASGLVTVPTPPTLRLVVPGTLSVHTGPMSYHFSVCIPGPL